MFRAFVVTFVLFVVFSNCSCAPKHTAEITDISSCSANEEEQNEIRVSVIRYFLVGGLLKEDTRKIQISEVIKKTTVAIDYFEKNEKREAAKRLTKCRDTVQEKLQSIDIVGLIVALRSLRAEAIA